MVTLENDEALDAGAVSRGTRGVSCLGHPSTRSASVIGGADRAGLVSAEIPREATREALGFRNRDRESERLESPLGDEPVNAEDIMTGARCPAHVTM